MSRNFQLFAVSALVLVGNALAQAQTAWTLPTFRYASSVPRLQHPELNSANEEYPKCVAAALQARERCQEASVRAQVASQASATVAQAAARGATMRQAAGGVGSTATNVHSAYSGVVAACSQAVELCESACVPVESQMKTVADWAMEKAFQLRATNNPAVQDEVRTLTSDHDAAQTQSTRARLLTQECRTAFSERVALANSGMATASQAASQAAQVDAAVGGGTPATQERPSSAERPMTAEEIIQALRPRSGQGPAAPAPAARRPAATSQGLSDRDAQRAIDDLISRVGPGGGTRCSGGANATRGVGCTNRTGPAGTQPGR